MLTKSGVSGVSTRAVAMVDHRVRDAIFLLTYWSARTHSAPTPDD